MRARYAHKGSALRFAQPGVSPEVMGGPFEIQKLVQTLRTSYERCSESPGEALLNRDCPACATSVYGLLLPDSQSAYLLHMRFKFIPDLAPQTSHVSSSDGPWGLSFVWTGGVWRVYYASEIMVADGGRRSRSRCGAPK